MKYEPNTVPNPFSIGVWISIASNLPIGETCKALQSTMCYDSVWVKCNEVCSFECQLLSTDLLKVGPHTCDSGTFVTPTLEHNSTYAFMVIATDMVGNQGKGVTYTWETDLVCECLE